MPATPDTPPAAAGDGEVESDSGPAPSPSSTVHAAYTVIRKRAQNLPLTTVELALERRVADTWPLWPTTVRDRVITCWTATCPNCGGALSHVAEGAPSDHDARSIVRCTSCGRTFLVQITVTDASEELGRSRPRHPEGCGCPACSRARQTRCVRGHDLSGDVRVDSTGKRVCRICERQRRAA